MHYLTLEEFKKELRPKALKSMSESKLEYIYNKAMENQKKLGEILDMHFDFTNNKDDVITDFQMFTFIMKQSNKSITHMLNRTFKIRGIIIKGKLNNEKYLCVRIKPEYKHLLDACI